MTEEPSRTTLTDALIQFADKLGRIPTAAAMEGHGPYSARAYLDMFGTWGAALKAANLDVKQLEIDRFKSISDPGFGKHLQEVSEDDPFTAKLLADLRRLANDLQKTPTLEELAMFGQYSRSAYENRWGSWNNAVEEAGLETNFGGQGRKVTKPQLREALQRLAGELGTRPTAKQMNEYGEHSVPTYIRMFGSWTTACEECLDS